jgi:predicted DNA-binding protein with PD1-like motif
MATKPATANASQQDKAPGFFSSLKHAVHGAAHATHRGTRLVSSSFETAELMLIPLQAEAITDALEALNGTSLEDFRRQKADLLG